MEANPEDPTKLVGFDVEIAELIASELGRTPQFVEVEAGPQLAAGALARARITGHDGRRLKGEVLA